MWEPLLLAKGGGCSLKWTLLPCQGGFQDANYVNDSYYSAEWAASQAASWNISSDLSNNLAEKRHLSSFLQMRTESQKGWGLASTA